jgi:hypothetical protein
VNDERENACYLWGETDMRHGVGHCDDFFNSKKYVENNIFNI